MTDPKFSVGQHVQWITAFGTVRRGRATIAGRCWLHHWPVPGGTYMIRDPHWIYALEGENHCMDMASVNWCGVAEQALRPIPPSATESWDDMRERIGRAPVRRGEVA